MPAIIAAGVDLSRCFSVGYVAATKTEFYFGKRSKRPSASTGKQSGKKKKIVGQQQQFTILAFADPNCTLSGSGSPAGTV